MAKGIVAILLLAFFAALSARAQEPISVEPGLWETRVTTTINGKAEPDQTIRACYTPEQARDIVATMNPPAGNQPNCTRGHRFEGRVLSISMQCETQLGKLSSKVRSEIRHSFESGTRITSHTTLDSVVGKQVTAAVVKFERVWVGPCP